MVDSYQIALLCLASRSPSLVTSYAVNQFCLTTYSAG